MNKKNNFSSENPFRRGEQGAHEEVGLNAPDRNASPRFDEVSTDLRRKIKKILIVFNPDAGKGHAKTHALQLLNELEIQTPDSSILMFESHSLTAMQEFWATKPEADVAVIVGGDGTLGKNIDAMIKNDVDIPIFAFGKGTANDFATYLGTQTNAKEAAKTILNGETAEIDTLLVNGTDYAINVACGGAFTNGVNTYKKRVKQIWGKAAYLARAIFHSFNLKPQRVKFEIIDKDDNELVIEEDIFMFYIANSDTVGTIKNAAPLANISDGLLDLAIIKKCGLFERLAVKTAQSKCKIHENKNVIYLQGKSFTVSVDTQKPIAKDFAYTDLDGNRYTEYPFHIEVGKKIRFIIK
ncbi:MAG: YegS/Rv2252/BmrU family lipid kinase [Christensenellaceae bacterium]|jgi:diacylglycerol kinase (ATP)|nr:YegS/Rv2252/BmrU family lipid kinase [Christensenellaceae bacterium]